MSAPLPFYRQREIAAEAAVPVFAAPASAPLDYAHPDPLAVLRLVHAYFVDRIILADGEPFYCETCNERAHTIGDAIVTDIPHTPDCLYVLVAKAIDALEWGR